MANANKYVRLYDPAIGHDPIQTIFKCKRHQLGLSMKCVFLKAVFPEVGVSDWVSETKAF